MKKLFLLFIASPLTVFFFALLWIPNLAFGQLSITMTKTNVTCFGAANGQATATPAGGVPPYTYTWSNTATSQTIQNLSPGAYSVTVKDANQNTKVASIGISQPSKLNLNLSSQSQICDVAPDGNASALPYGGTPPFAYLWSNGKTNSVITQLTAGSYTATITDSKGCTVSDSVFIDNWHEGLWSMLSIFPSNCSQNDGWIHVSMASGTSPYHYIWSTGGSGSNLTNLAEGEYTVTVTDQNGCSTEVTGLVNNQGIQISATDGVCTCGYSNGTANVFPTSGAAPYQYLWSTGATTQMIDSLAAGTYTATVTDATGCTGVKMVPVVTDGGNPILGHYIPPKCLNQLATFVQDTHLPLYPEFQWNLNNPLDQIISGQGTDSITVKWMTSGAKVVDVLYGHNGIFCGGYAFLFTVFVCADTNAPWLNEVGISPNPFGDLLQIQLTEGTPEDATAILTDITGKPLLEKPCSESVFTMETAVFPSGLYFLKIRSKQGERVWKLVKI